MKVVNRIFVAVMILALGAFFLNACEKSYSEKNKEKVQKAEKKIAEKKQKEKEAKQKEEAKEDEAGQAKGEIAQKICFGKRNPKAAKINFKINDMTFSLKDDFVLTQTNANADKPLKLGVLANIKSSIDKNLMNLDSFIKQFKKEGVAGIVVVGDSSEKYDQLKAVFDYLGKEGLMVYSIMGNREVREDYNKVLEEVGKKYPNVIDMNQTRMVDLGQAALVSIPGYHDPEYIHNAPGCAYDEAQVQIAKSLAEEAQKPVVLVSHPAPRGKGKTAIDSAVEAGNVGDVQLNTLIKQAKIPFGLHGNVHEAGGKAVGPDFSTVIPEGKMAETLYLNPGPVDSDPFQMNNGQTSKGMAALMTIDGGKASYQILKAKEKPAR